MFSALQADDTKDRPATGKNIPSLLSLRKRSSELGPAVGLTSHCGLLENSTLLCHENRVFFTILPILFHDHKKSRSHWSEAAYTNCNSSEIRPGP